MAFDKMEQMIKVEYNSNAWRTQVLIKLESIKL